MPKKILVVDDNRDTVIGLNFALERAGYEVAYAYDGQEGYIMAMEFKPDIIILDVMMPVMDGVTMNRHLKENPETRNTPVIIVTVKKDAIPLFDSPKGRPIAACLTKPFRYDELLKKVQEVLKEN